MKNRNMEAYKNPYGTWRVITEGDVEGRTIQELGTYTGFVDEIAFHLADQVYYSLRFIATKEVKKFIPKEKEVNISFDINSGTWDLTPSERLKFMKEVFHDRPVLVSNGKSFASVLLTNEKISQADIDRKKALEKLTDKEKELLGLN